MKKGLSRRDVLLGGIAGLATSGLVVGLVHAQQQPLATGRALIATETVNVDNYIRAETDNYFKEKADAGAFGKFGHERQPPSLDKQAIIRMNRDTIYSFVVLDLTEPATIVLPDPGNRFMSMQVINEDQYTKIIGYRPGEYELTRDKIGTRYVWIQLRIFANPYDPEDMKTANALQDRVKIRQRDPGKLELPNWDQEQRLALRKAILGLVPFVPDSRRMFGDVSQVDPVRFFIGTAGGWGGNPFEDAIYLPVVPEKNDGKTPLVLTVPKDVPVDGFWSISVYNADGYFEKNPQDAYSVNNVTAKRDADGKVTVHFGGDPGQSNFLAIMPGWNYIVRLYHPRQALIDGTWKFPAPESVK